MLLTKWSFDPTHSEITFKVKHLMITNVTGHFKQFTVSAETEGNDFRTVKNIHFSADAKSLETNNEKRNEDLRSSAFFNIEKYPKVEFSGTKYEINGDEAKLHGNLSIGGITKPITLNVDFGGVVKDPWGGERAGFNITGKVSRKEFGMTYNTVMEAGGVVVGDEVKINAEVELVKQDFKEEEK